MDRNLVYTAPVSKSAALLLVLLLLDEALAPPPPATLDESPDLAARAAASALDVSSPPLRPPPRSDPVGGARRFVARQGAMDPYNSTRGDGLVNILSRAIRRTVGRAPVAIPAATTAVTGVARTTAN